MSKSQRLFDLMQILRRHRTPVSGNDLAAEAGVSLRTIYRDIADLQGLGAQIDGEPGFGYVLQPGFLLPPLMFSEQEIQALALGAQWVSRQTDDEFALAARDALAKIGAVLPSELQHSWTTVPFTWGAGRSSPKPSTFASCGKPCATNTSFPLCIATRKARRPRGSSGQLASAFSIPDASLPAGAK